MRDGDPIVKRIFKAFKPFNRLHLCHLVDKTAVDLKSEDSKNQAIGLAEKSITRMSLFNVESLAFDLHFTFVLIVFPL